MKNLTKEELKAWLEEKKEDKSELERIKAAYVLKRKSLEVDELLLGIERDIEMIGKVLENME